MTVDESLARVEAFYRAYRECSDDASMGMKVPEMAFYVKDGESVTFLPLTDLPTIAQSVRAMRQENDSYRQSRADMDARHAELSAALARARAVLDHMRPSPASAQDPDRCLVWVDRAAWQAWQQGEEA